MITSIAFGTVFGSTVQCGSVLAVAQTPNWNVLRRRREAAGLVAALNPSWPVSTTVNAPAAPGCAEAGLGHA